MAMVSCSECGRAISDKAPACVGCGAPLPGAARTAVDPHEMSHLFAGVVAGSVDEALSLASREAKREKALVVVTGSMVLVGEARPRPTTPA